MSKRSRFLVALAAVCLTVLSLVGTEAVKANTKTFATIVVTNNDWAMMWAKGAEETCKKYGYNHITMNPESDIQKQIDLVQSCISQGVDGFQIMPVDDLAVLPILEQALDAGIYVFASGDDVEAALGGHSHLFSGYYDHQYAAALAAEALGEAIGGKGKVGIIAGIAGASNTMERSIGFRNKMAELYPDVEIVNEIACDWDRAIAMNATEDMIIGNPDIAGFYCMGEEMAWGVLEAVEDSGKDIKIVTIDASTPTVEMVMEGKIYACIGCPPKYFSTEAVEIFHELMQGKVPSQTTYGVSPSFMTQETASLDKADY